MSAIRTERALKCIYLRELSSSSRNSVITDITMRKNRFEPQEATRAKPARERVFMLSIGRKLHDAIVSGQSIESLYKSDVSFNFVRQDVISGLWFSEKLKVTTLSKLRPICLLVKHWWKVLFWRHTLFYSVLCLLITLPCSPKAELRRAQLNGIGRMHVRGACGCCETAMNDPGAAKPDVFFN